MFQADIIVFPEIGLIGFGNKEYDSVVPAPEQKVTPCLSNATHDTVSRNKVLPLQII